MERRLFYLAGTREFREYRDTLSSVHAGEVDRILKDLAERWEGGNELTMQHIRDEVYRIRRTGTDIEYRLFVKKLYLSLGDDQGSFTVLVPLAVVRRDDDTVYNSLIERAQEGSFRIAEQEIEEIRRCCIEKFRSMEAKLPESSDEVRAFLNALRGFHEQSAHLLKDNIVVYESYSFCEWTRNLDNTQLKAIHRRVLSLIEDVNKSRIPMDGQIRRSDVKISEAGWRAVFYYRAIRDEQGSLLFVCCEEDHRNKDVRRVSLRSYPSYVLYDDELWIAIQKERAVSLALSPEEEKIIEDVLRKQELPVFISGRAGSGKSTMLYYIFSNYWYYLSQFRDKMLFLTYTEKLQKNASNQMQRITELLARTDNRDTRQEDKIPVKMMREFLRELLGDAESRYPDDKYLKFYQFRDLLRKNHNIQVSEDLCWHVIRTYIKGYYPDRLMKPEEYQQIPSRDKTVTDEEFLQAYKAFEWFRENYQEYWDELDLVRELLARNELPEYYIIFCDEAQDFTRVEFELMFRLSFASRYNFMHEFPVVPIILAGDPLQTINPTGFRPEALRASLYNLVVNRVQCDSRPSSVYYRELVHNYRCSEDITRLSNLINLLRATLLARRPEEYGNPQAPWRKGSSIPPGLVDINYFNTEAAPDSFHIIIHPELKEQLKEQLINSSEEEKTKEHRAIATLIQKEEPNLWTPLEIKGLEQDDVVVYGFGEILNQLLRSMRIGAQSSLSLEDPEIRNRIASAAEKSTEARIRLEYFFSNLYVAITRGVNRLYLVDTRSGRDTLWNFMLDEGRWASLLETTRSPEWSTHENFVGIVPEKKISTKPINQREEARQAEERWATEKDTDAARRAILWYRKLGNWRKAATIQAEVYEYEGDWGKAAGEYEKAGDFEKASICYFRSADWRQAGQILEHENISRTPINEWMRTWAAVRHHIEYALSRATLREQEQWLADIFWLWLSQTEEVLNEHAQGIDRQKIREEVRRTLDEVGGKLRKEARLDYHSTLLNRHEDLLRFISPDLRLNIIQRLKNEYWNERRYSDFIKICDRYGRDEDEGRYMRAQAEVEGFPEGLKYLIQAGAKTEAVQFWKDHGSQPVAEAVELAKDLAKQGDVAGALEIAVHNSRPDLVTEVLDISEGLPPRDELVERLQRLLTLATDDAQPLFLESLLVACLKMRSRRETFQTLHLCIQANIEAKQIIGTVIECGTADFLIREILGSEMLARSGSDYLLQDIRLVSYILNGVSAYQAIAQNYNKTIEDFMYKFSGRVYKIVRRKEFGEVLELINEIDYLHDIIKFRLSSVVSEPRRAAIIRDLLRAKDILIEQNRAKVLSEGTFPPIVSLVGEGCTYTLRYLQGRQLAHREDERAYYLPLPNTPIIVRLLRHERKILCVNTETGDTKSYHRFPKDATQEKLWDYGEAELESNRITIKAGEYQIHIEVEARSRRSPSRASQSKR
jgi:hypothetical protein